MRKVAACVLLAGLALVSCGARASFSIASISAGGSNTCAVTTTGAAVCWGDNYWGQLGNGSPAPLSAVPSQVYGLQTGVASISTGGGHACAVTVTGGLKCWGFNSYGQLGDGTTTNRSLPVDVSGLSSGVLAVSAGGSTTCALLSTGALKCWGQNQYGTVGDGSEVNRSVPADVSGLSSGVASVDLGYYHACAVTTTGAVKCWGLGVSGQLGDGGQHYAYSPVDVIGLSSGVAAVATGENHTCALMLAGGVKCWGIVDTLGYLPAPQDIGFIVPPNFTPLSGIVAISAAARLSYAITSGGTAWFWPRRDPIPTIWAPQDLGLTGVVAVTAAYEHACALLADGKAMCWGHNRFGELGIGSTDSDDHPPVLTDTSAVDTRALQSITLAPVADRDVNSGPFAVTATASSGLAVTLSSVSSWVCTVSGKVVTLVEAGICTLSAHQAGDASTLPAPVVQERFVVTGVPPASPTRLANISTRVVTQFGFENAIAGFVIGGVAPKTVVVRVLGPSLAAHGVANPLNDFFIGAGVLTNTPAFGENPDAMIARLGLAPPDAREIAKIMVLAPGLYTVVVQPKQIGSSGTVLVEVYEIDRAEIPFINISTRGQVLTGDGAMIAGFVVKGNSPQTVMVRAMGPSLANYGVQNVLSNPQIHLVRMSDNAVIASNDDWGTATNAGVIARSNLVPASPLESAILITLEPGAYTAVVTGVGGATGVGLVEVYAQ